MNELALPLIFMNPLGRKKEFPQILSLWKALFAKFTRQEWGSLRPQTQIFMLLKSTLTFYITRELLSSF